jgi:hypothetical protein
MLVLRREKKVEEEKETRRGRQYEAPVAIVKVPVAVFAEGEVADVVVVVVLVVLSRDLLQLCPQVWSCVHQRRPLGSHCFLL